jgi:hypothetical protein
LVGLPLYVWVRADDLLSVHEASPQVETLKTTLPMRNCFRRALAAAMRG